MSTFIPLLDAAPRLNDGIDWTHSFIRECYFSTQHCFMRYEDQSGRMTIGESDSPLNLRLVIAVAGNPKVHGIDFICLSVKVFSIQRLNELKFEWDQEHGFIRLAFSNSEINSEDCWIVCKDVHVSFLGDEYLGPQLRLGYEFPDSNAIIAKNMDECWRQCPRCSNAWIENPAVCYSRCTECGSLTVLQS